MEANDEFVDDDPMSRLKLKAKQKRVIKAKQMQMNQKYGHLQKRKVSLIKFNAVKWPSPFLQYSKRTGNIFMELEREEKGIKYFRFKFDREYNRSQMEYKQRARTFDPEQISFFLSQHPYHVSGMHTYSSVPNKRINVLGLNPYTSSLHHHGM